MTISIIIPNYNGESLLKKNLPKVIDAIECYQKKQKAEAEVIIIDDGSTDKSLEVVQSSKFNPPAGGQSDNLKFKIIKNEKNLGFSSTVNRGVSEARGGVLVLLNTDIAPEKDFLEPLLRHFEDSKVFAVGCMDKSIEGSKIVLRGRGIAWWEKGFFVHKRGEVDKTDTFWVSGGSGAFKKSIWDKLGGFDELYSPFYWEDIDLSYRAIKSGYKVLFEPNSVVVHEHSIGAINKQYSPLSVKIISYRNQFIFIWKNITDLNLILSHVFWLPWYLLKAIINMDSAFFIGFFNALILLPKIKKSSFESQKLFIKKDKGIIISYSIPIDKSIIS